MRLSYCCWALLALWAVSALSSCKASTAWSIDTYPNPMVDTSKCGRGDVKSWVCDPDATVSYQSANEIEGYIKKIHAGKQAFRCCFETACSMIIVYLPICLNAFRYIAKAEAGHTLTYVLFAASHAAIVCLSQLPTAHYESSIIHCSTLFKPCRCRAIRSEAVCRCRPARHSDCCGPDEEVCHPKGQLVQRAGVALVQGPHG